MARAIGIRVHRGEALVDTQVFERDIIKIGRLASAHLRLEDNKVSRIHAVIDIANGNEVSVIDMGSAEGTRVNGEKVSRVRLKHGDEIGLGDSRLVVVLDEAEVAALGKGTAPPPAEAPAPVVTPPAAEVPVRIVPTDVFASAAADVRALRAELADTAPVAPPVAEASEVFARPVGVDDGPPIGAPASITTPPPAVQAPAATAVIPRSSRSSVATRPAVKELRRTPQPPPAMAAPMTLPPLPPIPEDKVTPENRYIEVALRWGKDVVECKRLRNVNKLTIGTIETSRGAKDKKEPSIFLPLEGTVAEPVWDLVRSTPGAGWAVRYTSRMAGNVTRGGASVPLSQAGGAADGEGFALPLTDDTAVSLAIGPFTLDVRVVPKSRVIPIAPLFDVLWANTAVITMFATAATLAVVTLMPVGLDSLEDDLFTNPSKFQTLILKPPPKDFLDKLKGPKQAAKAKGKEGEKRAKKDVKPKAKDKPTDEQVVASKLNALFGDKGSGIAQLFGDNTGSGALEAALGGIDGARIGAVGGLGLRGGAPGGGGTGLNTLSGGKVGTRGRGSGDLSYGSGEGGLGGKVDRDVSMTQGTPVILGSLDKEIIRRIVQEHASQIRYCYEKELTRTPGIYGKVKMKWVINGEGKVTQSQTEETQMKNANVENCLATKIKTWVFPKPKGGGIVIVSYPFVFKQSGG
jgi:hypothetical protein